MVVLNSIGISHGDVQPKNIKVSDAGEISLIDFNCYEQEANTGYRKMLANYQYATPLSPQLIKGLVTKEMDVSHSKEKNDVFGLGMTILCAASISNFRTFYDFTYGNILTDRINEKIEFIYRLGYSEYFIKCIVNMLNPKEEARPSFKEQMNFLSPSLRGK